MVEDVDYKSVATQLQSENEQLRLYILKLKQAKFNAVSAITTGNVKRFLVSNYLVISSAALIIFVSLAFFDTVKNLFSKE